ncbi:tetratricopeptide repeat protein [Castellaniella sp.]|uniref:tetratricopeptide repeat protein n=1 Tax=Castellaniella sp. TaxID=1955812 RepID=UPI002AFED407|nr:tetratricopeptide repeat protein [Castellaniella sp.]
MLILIKKSLIWASVLLLAACSAPQTVVRPIDTLQDTTALAAGELRIAASALQSGDVPVALSLYSELSKTHPKNVDVWVGLGDAHFLSADYAAARASYNRALQLSPGLLEARLALARVDIRVRNLDQAILQYQAMLVDSPDDPLVLSGLGVAYDLSGQRGLAQETYRKGLGKHSGNEILRTNLGLSLALDGKPREAVNVLLGYDGVNHGLPQRRDNLALAYGLLGREDTAENILLSYQSRGQVQDNLAFYRYLRTHQK